MYINHEKQVKQRFDRWSKSRIFQRLSPWLVYVQEHILNLIDWTKVSQVLDIGCGSGKAVYEIAKRLEQRSGAIACGCDLSTGMLQKGLYENAESSNACFISASAQALPFRENSFDVVLSTIAFHHFPSPLTALEEFRRVLCGGGRVLIADVLRDISLGTWVFDRLHRWFEDGHVKYYRIDEVTAMLKNSGFDDIQVSKINPPFSETKKIFRRAGIFSAMSPQ
jgi:demethylmenaquinone methyltransferase/2-methoxy-6-polyprenyl-1,4-benzoquinol methylase